MKIDKRLNIVIPITRDDGTPLFVHSTPISSEVFNTYFLPIAKTFSAIYGEGLGALAGPRIADKMLRKISKDMGVWDGPGGVEQGLVAEFTRLTNVIAPGKKGWETIPYHEAKSKGVVSPEDASEVDAAICFFMVISSMHRRTEVPEILGGSMKLWGAQIESSNSTEFMSSLPSLTETESSGATAVA